jgi:hypothetical protein
MIVLPDVPGAYSRKSRNREVLNIWESSNARGWDLGRDWGRSYLHEECAQITPAVHFECRVVQRPATGREGCVTAAPFGRKLNREG